MTSAESRAALAMCLDAFESIDSDSIGIDDAALIARVAARQLRFLLDEPHPTRLRFARVIRFPSGRIETYPPETHR